MAEAVAMRLSEFTRLPRFARFLLVGGLNTAFGYGFFLLVLQLPLPLWLVVLVANVGALCFNFKTTGSLVFGSRDPRRALRFLLSYAAMYGINLAALQLLLSLGLRVVPASALLLAPMAVLSYTMGRLFVFTEKPKLQGAGSEPSGSERP